MPADVRADEIVGQQFGILILPDLALFDGAGDQGTYEPVYSITVGFQDALNALVLSSDLERCFDGHAAVGTRNDILHCVIHELRERFQGRLGIRSASLDILFAVLRITLHAADKQFVLVTDRIVEATRIDLHRVG